MVSIGEHGFDFASDPTGDARNVGEGQADLVVDRICKLGGGTLAAKEVAMNPMGEGASHHSVGEFRRGLVDKMFGLATDGDSECGLNDVDGGSDLDSRLGRSGLDGDPRGEHPLEAKSSFVISEGSGLGYGEINGTLEGWHIAHHTR